MAPVPEPFTATQVRAFFEDGYLVVPDLFAPEEVATLRRAFRRLEQVARRLGVTRMFRGSRFVLGPGPDEGAGAEAGVRIERVVWCGAVEPVLSTFGRDARLLRMAAQLLDVRRVQQLINQAHFKLPGDDVAFPWHQDSTHRRYGGAEWRDVNGRGSYVQTVLAVDEATLDNGPLELLPGSCRSGHVEPSPDDPHELPPGLRAVAPVAVTLQAGSVVLFGPFTFHRSGPNRSSRPRRALINGYACPGANSRRYPGRGAGRILEVD